MAFWDRLRGLELNVEGFGTERKSVDVSSQFTRVSTTVVVGGDGAEGRGEDITYTAPDHDWFPQLEPPGRTTLQELSAQLDGLQLFNGEPGMAASRDYRRWAFESAALDLALRQNELSLGAALEREYGPVRFVVSTRDDAFAWLEHNPELELKLDPENDWDRPFMERLAATGRVRVLDLKAYYTGTPVDVVPDPELYRAVVPNRDGLMFSHPGSTGSARTSATEWIGASKLSRPSCPCNTVPQSPSSDASSSTASGKSSTTARYSSGSGTTSTGVPV